MSWEEVCATIVLGSCIRPWWKRASAPLSGHASKPESNMYVRWWMCNTVLLIATWPLLGSGVAAPSSGRGGRAERTPHSPSRREFRSLSYRYPLCRVCREHFSAPRTWTRGSRAAVGATCLRRSQEDLLVWTHFPSRCLATVCTLPPQSTGHRLAHFAFGSVA